MSADPDARYLTSALAWLRLRLLGGSAEDVEQARKEMLDNEAADPQASLCFLAERLGLSRFERDTLLLCLAFELDPGLAPRLAERGEQPAQATFALALATLEDPAWDALTPASPLRYWRLVELAEHAPEPLLYRPLRADEWLVHLAKGIIQLDPAISRVEPPLLASGGQALLLPESAERLVARVIEALRDARPGAPLLVQLVGPDSASKQLVAERAAHDLGRHLHLLSPLLLPEDPGALELLSRLCDRQTLLDAAAFMVEVPAAGAPAGGALERFARRVRGLLFADVPSSDWLGERALLTLDVGRPSAQEQRVCWSSILGGGQEGLAGKLATQFDLSLTALRGAARDAAARMREHDEPVERVYWNACVRATRPRAEALAQRVSPTATWDDIVLPEQAEHQLRRMAGQVAMRARVYDDWGFRRRMSRGLGVTALFTGASGTGKTMAAEVLANELGVDLFRIDLSAVVSKFIGETEKNLRRLFDASEAGGAILFFDEADALFGKRSEVRDSHDRYANIEINYLLQRLEEYRGLAILATNARTALDTAFTRRLRFVVTFEHPDRDRRRRIWERAFPPGVPTDDIDWERLSGLSVTGASIRNIALAAAFRAAELEAPVTLALIAEAAHLELRKMEIPTTDVDLMLGEPEEDWR